MVAFNIFKQYTIWISIIKLNVPHHIHIHVSCNMAQVLLASQSSSLLVHNPTNPHAWFKCCSYLPWIVHWSVMHEPRMCAGREVGKLLHKLLPQLWRLIHDLKAYVIKYHHNSDLTLLHISYIYLTLILFVYFVN